MAQVPEQGPADAPVPPSKDLLRLVAIGSVDDGKSTLIGRLLYESGAVYQDQIDAVSEGGIDFALLTDGLAAEREQGITIDVAYRFWDTPDRRFIIADTPGHLQYTRNMVTGSSSADAAIILIDAKLGVLEQSRRHAYIASLLGVPTLIVAVNKMDSIGYDQARFEAIKATFSQDLKTLGCKVHRFIPISALQGDNVTSSSAQMPWFQGDPLAQELHRIAPKVQPLTGQGMVFPVQTVLRAEGQRRGYAGTLLGEEVKVGDEVLALPSKQRTRVVAVKNPSDDRDVATPSRPTQLCLADELDLSRGDLLVSPRHPGRLQRHAIASLVWMHESPLALNRSYFVKLSTKQCSATVTHIEHRMDLQSLTATPSETLTLNQIAKVQLSLSELCLLSPYAESRELGSFVLIDRTNYATVAAGMIQSIQSDAPRAPGTMTHTERARRFAQQSAHLGLFGDPQDCHDIAAQLESHLMSLGHLAYNFDVERIPAQSRNAAHRQAALAALLDSGHVVIQVQPDPTPAPWTRVELTLPCAASRDEQLDALVLELGARGILGATTPTTTSQSGKT